MEFAQWLENTGFSTWVRESPRIWAFPVILLIHTIGMALCVGVSAGINFRILGFAPSLLPALVIFFCIGAANIVFLVPNITISQEVTPPELRARVAGARMALLNITWLPMFAISGALADVVDAGVLIAVAGALTLATAVIGAFAPTVRDVP